MLPEMKAFHPSSFFLIIRSKHYKDRIKKVYIAIKAPNLKFVLFMRICKAIFNDFIRFNDRRKIIAFIPNFVKNAFPKEFKVPATIFQIQE